MSTFRCDTGETLRCLGDDRGGRGYDSFEIRHMATQPTQLSIRVSAETLPPVTQHGLGAFLGIWDRLGSDIGDLAVETPAPIPRPHRYGVSGSRRLFAHACPHQESIVDLADHASPDPSGDLRRGGWGGWGGWGHPCSIPREL